jgi:hypothetical protein
VPRATVQHRYGPSGETDDGLPFIGSMRTENSLRRALQWLTLGTLSAMMARDRYLTGRPVRPVPRGSAAVSRWSLAYVRENLIIRTTCS